MKGEASSIFYRKNRFDRLDAGTFWLSQTPDVVGSFGWDAECVRICTWVRLKDRQSGQVILAANTHFDHVGKTARLESAKLIAERLSVFKGDAMLLTGDFNSIETDPVYAALLSATKERGLSLIDTYRAVHPKRQSNEGSFNGFTGNTDGLRIDWIFCSSHFVPVSSVIDQTKSVNGRYPSDHYPIWARLRFAK